jgi:hypothetical protein
MRAVQFERLTMHNKDRHAFSQNFRWDADAGAWETVGTATKVLVVPPSEHAPYWWIRTEPPDGEYRNFEDAGNVAEWQAFHDAAKLAQKTVRVVNMKEAAR